MNPAPTLRAIVTDIEGTTGSFSFVYDELFPYADAHLDAYVESHANDAQVRDVLQQVAKEAQIDPADRAALVAQLHRWIAQDSKATPLKTLQGMIWAAGYADGTLRGHVYEDAANALRAWHAAGLRLYVYSSGSIAAQKLIFGHSTKGDLTPLFSGYFDTTTGPKREAASYERIARAAGIEPGAMLFLSDTESELDAARAAGMRTVHVARESCGTKPSARHPVAESFAQVDATQ